MKIKKLLITLFAACSLFAMASATACGKDDSSSSSDNSMESSSSEVIGGEILYTITIKDQDGGVVKGVSFKIVQGATEIGAYTTDENGQADVIAPAVGDYSIVYTEMPPVKEGELFGYDANPETAGIGIVTDFVVNEVTTNVTLVISNWESGSSLNPHICYYGTNEETGETDAFMTVPTIKANTSHYYGISKAMDRILHIEQADVTIVYNGVTYNAKDGAVDIQMLGEAHDSYYVAKLQIINNTATDIELTATLIVSEDETEEGENSSSENESFENSEETASSIA